MKRCIKEKILIDVLKKVGPQNVNKPSEGNILDKAADLAVGNAMGKAFAKFV